MGTETQRTRTEANVLDKRDDLTLPEPIIRQRNRPDDPDLLEVEQALGLQTLACRG